MERCVDQCSKKDEQEVMTQKILKSPKYIYASMSREMFTNDKCYHVTSMV